MGFLLWLVIPPVILLCSLHALTAYALRRGLNVKTGLHIPFVGFSFETHTHPGCAESAEMRTRITAASTKGRKLNLRR
jgi:hypothetical protein